MKLVRPFDFLKSLFAVRFLIWSVFVMAEPLLAADAFTQPRGIYTVKIPGTPDAAIPVRTHFGIQLLPDVQISGIAQNVSGTSLTFSGGADLSLLADPERTSYLHVVEGSGNGFVADVEQFTANGVVCSEDLSQWIEPGSRAVIRPHSTISDIFGEENAFGLSAGLDAASSDNVVLWDAETQQEKVYYFHSTRSRWEESGVIADQSNAVLRFPYGLYVVRRSPDTLRIAISGMIGSDSILLPVDTGANVFSLPINLSNSLENLVRTEGDFSVSAGSNATNSDILIFHEPTGGRIVGPFYRFSEEGNASWREVGIDDSTAPLAPLDLLSTLIIRRTAAPARLFVRGSIIPSANPPIMLPPDPEPGEIQLVGELKTPKFPPGFRYSATVETSTDLQAWTPVTDLGESGGVVRFNLPSGQRRAFYRLRISPTL